MVLDCEEIYKEWRLGHICSLNDANEDKAQFPLTHNIKFVRAQVTDGHPIEELEAGIKLQNTSLLERYTCTVSGIPNCLDFFTESVFTRRSEPGAPAASILLFDKKFYDKLGIKYEGILDKVGKLKSGNYYFQGKSHNESKILELLTTHLEDILEHLYKDLFDFSDIEVFGKQRFESTTFKVTDILKQMEARMGWMP